METIIALTLLHSLWQGLILAAAAGLILLLTRNAAPALRYRCLTAALLAFTAGMAATFVLMTGKMLHAGSAMRAAGGRAPYPLRPFAPDLLSYITIHAGLIVWTWLLILCAKGIRMGYGLYAVHRLKHVQVYEPGRYWAEKVSEISTRLGIRRRVRILQSGLAGVPLTIGHLKPIILMPLGLISRLTVAEVEAIISHELAHIRRKDYLVNLLQSFLELVFFFNPAVLWLNGLIRQERENCCDDLALRADVGPRDYINALVSCYAFQPKNHRFAMAFPGVKGQLAGRISRIAGLKMNNKSARPRKVVLALIVLCAGLAIAALSARDGSGRRTVTRHTRIENDRETRDIREVSSDEGLPAAADQGRPAPSSPETARAAAADNQEEGFTEADGAAMHQALYRDGILPDPDNASYSLDKDALIVNDVRQPEDIRRKYAARYLKQAGTIITYNYHKH